MRLTRDERKAICAGTLKVIRRPAKPAVEPGEEVVVSWTRGGKQLIELGDDRDSRRRRQKLLEEGKSLTIDVPRRPNVWFTIKGWRLKDGQRETEILIFDRRQASRRLAPGAPSGVKREPGLRTRVHAPAPKVDSPDDLQTWTPETERGYGGTGEEAVDDETLEGFLRSEERGGHGVAERNDDLQAEQRRRAKQDRSRRRAARERERGNVTAVTAIERRVEQGAAA